MEDLNQIADALEEMGATVDRANFADKMRNPAFVESVRTALAEGGADVRDSAAFHQKWSPAAQAPAQVAPRPVPEGFDAVSGAAYRPQAQPAAAPTAQNQPPSVLEILFPSQQESARSGRGFLAGNIATAKDLLTMPFRTAAGVGSYAGTLGSELRQGGLDSPKDFGQALMAAKNQSEQDMSTVGADINYPGWAQGFVAPARDPVAAALALLPLGKPVGALAKALGAAGLGSGALAPAASVASEALLSPIGQGLGIGATGAGIGLGMSAADRAVTPGESVTDVSPQEIKNAALITALGGGMSAIGTGGARISGALAPRLEATAGRWIRKAVKPNGLDAQQALETALVEDRLLPEMVGNRTITPGGIADRYNAAREAISGQIGPALAEADKAGSIYSSAQALGAGRNALQDALRMNVAIATPRQEAAIVRNMTESLQNQKPMAAGPWLPGSIPEAPMNATQAYNAKKALQDWGFNRIDADPLLPSRSRAEASLGASRDLNQQLAQSAPAVKELDRRLAPYSAIRDAMETAAGPRENRYILYPGYLGAAGHIAGARQAWNIAQALRGASRIQPAVPASTAVYLEQALQRNTPQQ